MKMSNFAQLESSYELASSNTDVSPRLPTHVREEVELRLYLDQIGLKKRILLHGLEAVRNRNRIQLIPKQRE
jgi:hypothetical protein